ncbi:(R)-mandelonitrile lyase [Hymenobacter perfusus]|uniref:Cupin domain-containing protein n=1 Tax=Hymenobacter perfusus TaxID=1236770 RepID=A0A428KJ59_9BACT|nr:cupin domain-containing protein [Hymenobacter perfusus]RSK46375.1 cupin domain-containing protein [Hymenobacter perfusus]
MKKNILTAAALAALVGLAGCSQPAPPAATEAVATPAAGAVFPQGDRAPAENFTGTVYLHPLVKEDSVFNCVSGSVTFTPGARSNWHTHPDGQILMIINGLGYYQEKGQPVRLLREGEVVQCQPGVEHWHGASPKQAMTHISLNVNTEKGIINWLKPVTDQEYNAYKP